MPQKVPKQGKAKRDKCNKPTKLQFQSILRQKILMLSNATNQQVIVFPLWALRRKNFIS